MIEQEKMLRLSYVISPWVDAGALGITYYDDFHKRLQMNNQQ